MRVIAAINYSLQPKEAIAITESYGIKNSTNLVSDAPTSPYFAIFNTESQTVAFFNKINPEKTASYVNVTGSKCSSSGFGILCAIICDQVKLVSVGSEGGKDILTWSTRKSDKTDYSLFKGNYDMRTIYQLQRTNYLRDDSGSLSELYDIGIAMFTAKNGVGNKLGIDPEANICWTLFKSKHIAEILGCTIDEYVKHLKNTLSFEQVSFNCSSDLHRLREHLSPTVAANGAQIFGVVMLRGKNGIVYTDLGAFLQSIDLNYKMLQLTIRRMTTDIYDNYGRKSLLSNPLSFLPGSTIDGTAFNMFLLQGPPKKK